ncbi:DNA repair protein RecN [Weissella tructae]|jgi:DNA repair protein RecN (Recombination protein N)|uniref:DNA repair protein RecN n=2 Tax=Weissella TaxID=46255 RepID=A0A075TW90_9LACO|nr:MULTISPECIES: DNA repair protein RecN [Weissella]AIG65839.1 DNA repair protein RecN [Weissella tructae]AIM63218.1 DNA repair protein RecN [Weissella ceti]AIM64553.1 DNA repair protein RecN [Weissella ceti]ELA07210.1 DNA repair protein [Weissella ceti NC36]QVV90998.1 DNA repair protein RecN [Weissella tructae]
MLQELSIQNFAIIPKLNISFEPEMTVLTGETGAGKSIIIDAVGLLTGGRGSQEYIREGADKAVLQGLITINEQPDLLDLLEMNGIEIDEGQLLIHRELHRSGRNVIRVNGSLINATTLKELGRYLVDIHGQNDTQDLMQVEKHLSLLDEFGSDVIGPLKKRYEDLFTEYQSLKRALKKRQSDEQAWAQRLDTLTFQANELQAADLRAGEEETLDAEYQELTNFQDVLEALSKASEVLTGDWENNGTESVGTALSSLEDIEELSPRYTKLAESMREVYYNLRDVSSEIDSVRDGLEFDEEQLQYVNDRLNLIHNLEQKYGATIEDVLVHQDKVEQELAEMGGDQQSADQLAEQVTELEEQARTAAKALSKARTEAAETLVTLIHEQLQDLHMSKARFEVHIDPLDDLQGDGQDKVEFYIQTNEGEQAKPLVKIASGGELSRMMLAMKMIFSRQQGVTSIVFDEVDTGVSGRVAQAMADKIADMASHSQVLTITHLPQVAAVAHHHVFIHKDVIDGRTETAVDFLDEDARVDELARMLSGDELTEAAQTNARDLIDRAVQRRNVKS